MIRALASRWRATVLVCAKCEKKLGGRGFGRNGDKPLSRLLRRKLGAGRGRKAAAGVVATRCLGICPKNGVTLLNAARPGEWIVAPAGTPARDVIDRLGLTELD